MPAIISRSGVVALAALALVLTSCGGSGSSGPGGYPVIGTLTGKASGQPIAGCKVGLKVGSQSTVTSSSGTFTLTNVASGSETLVFTDAGGTQIGSYAIDVYGVTACGDISVGSY
jgi:hypothetical protein